jgi:hypothetical protein
VGDKKKKQCLQPCVFGIEKSRRMDNKLLICPYYIKVEGWRSEG